MKSLFKKIIVTLLTAEAKLVLRRHKPKIIAVTGSVGKTSTKDAIYAAIKNSVDARKNQMTFNTEVGVPLTILDLPNGWSNPFVWIANVCKGLSRALFMKSYPKVLVLEMGIDKPGDMQELTKWITPDVVVLTKFPDVPTHVEFFSSPEAVATEKMYLAEALAPEGVLVYNADDERINKMRQDIRQTQVGFSRYRESDFTARGDRTEYVDNFPISTILNVQHTGVMYDVTLAGTVGSQNSYAVAAALAVAEQFGINLQTAAVGLSQYITPRSRMRVLAGLKSTLIIDDSYNSSPDAAKAALETLDELQHATRKIAVLGDMLELGKFSSEAHRELGVQAAEVCDVVLAVGQHAQQIVDGAQAAGIDTIYHYDDVDRAGRELQGIMQPGDYILVKASQGIRAEKIVEEVMAEPERAPSLLVRQSEAWLNR